MIQKTDIELAISFVFMFTLLGISAWAAFSLARSLSKGTTPIGSALTFIWAVPLAFLFDPNALLPADYIAHAGLTAAAANMIRAGVWLPHAGNTFQMIGDPTLSLAGRIDLLIMGYLAVIAGSPISIRLFIFFITIIQIRTAYQVVGLFTKDKVLALTGVALSYWTTYSLNNLYDRGAIAEFLATSMASSAICLLILCWFCREPRRAVPLWTGLAACTSGFILTHPITGIYGTLMMIITAALLILFQAPSPRLVARLIAAGALTTIIVLPWVYLLSVHPPSQSAIASTFELKRFPGLDRLWLRLLPFPLSRLPKEYLHPYFVTQANTLFLAVIAVFALPNWRFLKDQSRRWGVYGLAVVTALMFIVSVSPVFDFALPQFIKASQFSYRLVSPINHGFFLIFLFVLAVVGDRLISVRQRRTLYAVSLFSLAGVLASLSNIGQNIAFTHVVSGPGLFRAQIQSPFPFLRILPTQIELETFSQSNGCSYAQMHAENEYIRCAPMEWADIRFDPLDGRALRNEFLPTSTPERKPGEWVTTNVVFYPWNRLFSGDQEISCDGYRYFCRFRSEVDWRSVRYRLVPEPAYLWLDRLSVGVFFIVFLIAAATFRRTSDWPESAKCAAP